MTGTPDPRRDEPIAVTGIGMSCALGTSLGEVMERLLAGESGIRPITAFDTASYAVKLGGEVPRLVEPAGQPLAADADRAERLLVPACADALRQAGLQAQRPVPRERVGLVLGTTVGGLRSGGEFLRQWRTEGPDRAAMALVAQNFPSWQQARLMERFELAGPALGIHNACASSADALGVALRWLRQGRADVVVAGGYDPMSEFTFAGFSALKLVTRTACRPFGRDRDGFHLGEGVALFVLERLGDARRRGARPLAILAGYGSAAEAHHLTHPEPQGRGGAAALAGALADAACPAARVAHVNVHGTGSPANDLAEFRAMRLVLGAQLERIPVTASKPALGHTLGAAGAVEAAVAVGTLLGRRIPPTLHTATLEAECVSLDLVRGEPRALGPGCVVSQSFGFGGSCAAVAFAAVGSDGGADA